MDRLQQRASAWTTATLLGVCASHRAHGHDWNGAGEDPDLETEALQVHSQSVPARLAEAGPSSSV